jgi:hypothetical protein
VANIKKVKEDVLSTGLNLRVATKIALLLTKELSGFVRY